MNKVVWFCMFLLVSGCAQQTQSLNGQPQWDFDHDLQFFQTELKDGRFHLVVIPNKKAKFNRLATFLLRKSMQLCKSYGFKLEILKGIEPFDQKKALPNLIVSRLEANLECPKK